MCPYLLSTRGILVSQSLCSGSALVHAMTAARERFDSAFEPPPTEQPIAGTGLGWLYFMGLNSNVRYNALNAAEDVLYAR